MAAGSISRRAGLSALLAAVLFPVLVPAGSEGRTASPSVGGTTIVSGAGHSGIVLNVPKKATLTEENFRVRLLKGATYAYVGLAESGPNAWCRDDDTFAVCFTHELWNLRLPKSALFLSDLVKNVWEPPIVHKGIHDLYILSDGPVRVSMRFTGLGNGTARLRATGSIDAISQKIPARCPDQFGDCSEFGFGGVTHKVRDPASVAVLAHAWIPATRPAGTQAWYPGSHGVATCVYPEQGTEGGSPDPKDHPYGCDFLPTEGSGGDWLGNGLFFGTRSIPTPGSTTTITWNYSPDGPIYAGFTAHQRRTLGEPGGYVAYGFWLEEGIGVPTR